MDVKKKIRDYIEDEILFEKRSSLSDTASFQTSGILDSTGFLELITFVEGEFDIEISNDELVPEYLDSIEKLSNLVVKKLAVQK
jgi:acyl carrier protein